MTDEFMGATASEADGGSPAPEAQKVTQDKPEYSEFLQAITNQEGKPKYKTVADALIGAAKAQEHIQRIEQENAELRGVTKKVETLEALIQRLETGKGSDQPVTQIEDPEKLVLSVMEKRERVRQEQANREQVLNALKSKFGDKTDDVLGTKAKDLGMSVAELGALAARSPQAVLAYFPDVKVAPTVQGTVNTQALQPGKTETKAPDNIMWGANTKDVVNFFRQIKSEVNEKYGLN